MKIRRHKHTKRVLKYYKANFKFDTKLFNVLIDGTFANEALNGKINLAEQLPKFFDVKDNKCKLWTTKCAIHETEILGKPTRGAMLILKQYQVAECKHKRNFISSEKCFKNLISESGDTKFIVATQSDSLKEIVRSVPGTPLMIISHNAINLEKPSEKTDDLVNKRLEGKLAPNLDQMKVIKQLKKKLNEQKPQVKRIQKKRKAKEPNPLSCKKKKKTQQFSNKK
ncbi:rRNA-processing UTP23 -like protein [Brachionus plicatilis]|uniref:rRNA-processing protein UTP23 homolog n=1 Tax=Brachionus plicatilis TaxID=10195 RepID=A0A3M7QG21_BRAPC|nr:rRNA-processing UTP23 -like protein [Brachionus plicatilis]